MLYWNAMPLQENALHLILCTKIKIKATQFLISEKHIFKFSSTRRYRFTFPPNKSEFKSNPFCGDIIMFFINIPSLHFPISPYLDRIYDLFADYILGAFYHRTEPWEIQTKLRFLGSLPVSSDQAGVSYLDSVYWVFHFAVINSCPGLTTLVS